MGKRGPSATRAAGSGAWAFAALVAASAALPVACSSNPTTDTSEGPLPDGGSSTPDGAASTSDARPPGDAGADAASSDTGTTTGPLPPRCDDLATSGGSGGRLATLDAPDLVRFDGVTPVLLSIAWTNAAGDVWVGDRGDPFSGYDAQKVGSAIAAPGSRAALAAAGTGIVVASGATLTAYTRTRVGAPWKGPAPDAFAAVNAWLAGKSATPAEPVLGSSGRSLFFLAVPASGPPELYESALDGASSAWATPVARAEIASADATHRRRPTGVSWDDLTLFYWDEAARIERSATRAAANGSFTTQVDVGPYPEAVPDQPCRLLYYQGSDGSGAGVFSTSGTL